VVVPVPASRGNLFQAGRSHAARKQSQTKQVPA